MTLICYRRVPLSRLDRHHPEIWVAQFPLNIGAVLDPLVAFCTIESNSSKENKIRYALRSRLILNDLPLGLGNFVGNKRGRGGGSLSRGRGRKSHMACYFSNL